MQEAKKFMKEKGIKAEDVKNLPPVEEIHGLNVPPPPKVVEIKSSMKLNDSDDPRNKHPSQCFMSLIILWLSKKTSMLMLVDN